MKKNILIFVAVSLLTLQYACNNSKQNSNKVDSTVSSSETSIDKDSLLSREELKDISLNVSSNESVTPPTATVQVKIRSIKGYAGDEAFAYATADTLAKILNSPGFKREVLRSSFSHNGGLTSEQIYNKIMNAHEEDGPGGQDKILDLRLRTITLEEDGQRWLNACSRSTIGIDGAGTGVTATCSNFIKEAASGKKYSWLAAHFIHEYMHVLNFTHPSDKPNSVPYKVHGIVETLGDHPERRN